MIRPSFTHPPMPPERPHGLDALLKKVAADAEALPRMSEYPDVDLARQDLLTKVKEALSRLVPEEIAALERQHGWAASFNGQMEFFTDKLLAGPEPKDAVISKAEMRKNAPGFGTVLDALKGRPELLKKVEQGFAELEVVPFGLSPQAYQGPIAAALCDYHRQGKVRSTDGTLLRLDADEPVWLWQGYEGADRTGKLVYFPQRFDRENHGGKTKQQVLAEGPQQSAGWMVVLREKHLNVPRAGKGQTIAGRPQIEAGHSSHQYLDLLNAAAYAGEQYLPPEAGLARFLNHLAATGGEVLYDYQAKDGTAELFPGAYFPSSGGVPCACWDRYVAQALVDGGGPGNRDPDDGARSAVRVV
jgi:hypothetical protein